MRVAAIAIGVTCAALAVVAACSLSGGVKDACQTSSDCNPGNVCTNGTCGLPGAAMTDAGVSDASDADASDAPPPFCINTPKPYTICDDFDEDAQAKNALYGWNNILDNMDVGVTGGGSIAVNKTHPFWYTPPRSVYFYLPTLAGEDEAVANLMKTLKSPATLGVQFRFYIQTEDLYSNRLDLVYLSFNLDAAFAIILDSSGLEVIVATGMTGNIQETTYPIAPSSDVALGMWHQLILAMVIDNADGGAGDYGILLDGNGGVSGALSAAFRSAGASEVDIGPAAQGDLGEFEIYMDDILIQ